MKRPKKLTRKVIRWQLRKIKDHLAHRNKGWNIFIYLGIAWTAGMRAGKHTDVWPWGTLLSTHKENCWIWIGHGYNSILKSPHTVNRCPSKSDSEMWGFIILFVNNNNLPLDYIQIPEPGVMCSNPNRKSCHGNKKERPKGAPTP